MPTWPPHFQGYNIVIQQQREISSIRGVFSSITILMLDNIPQGTDPWKANPHHCPEEKRQHLPIKGTFAFLSLY